MEQQLINYNGSCMMLIAFSFTQMKFFGSEDHDTDIPHLLHSVNVTQMDIEFVNLTVANASIGSPRIAMEMALIANETTTRPFTISERKTLNDEHTPATFKLIDIVSPDGTNGTQGEFLSRLHVYCITYYIFVFDAFHFQFSLFHLRLQEVMFNSGRLATPTRVAILVHKPVFIGINQFTLRIRNLI